MDLYICLAQSGPECPGHLSLCGFSLDHIRAELHGAFLLRSRATPHVTLKGQMVPTVLPGVCVEGGSRGRRGMNRGSIMYFLYSSTVFSQLLPSLPMCRLQLRRLTPPGPLFMSQDLAASLCCSWARPAALTWMSYRCGRMDGCGAFSHLLKLLHTHLRGPCVQRPYVQRPYYGRRCPPPKLPLPPKLCLLLLPSRDMTPPIHQPQRALSRAPLSTHPPILQACQLFLSDFPLHDMGREFVLLAEQRSAEAELKVWTSFVWRGRGG